MITVSVIIAGLNAVVLALTPEQRWQAIRQLDSNFMTEPWFTITMVVTIIVLTAALILVSLYRRAQEQKAADQLFEEYAKQRGLSRRERQILLDIANCVRLKRTEAIFTMVSAFDQGAAKLIEESLVLPRGAEQSKRLRTEISFLRQKLGFHKQDPSSIGQLTSSKELSSRQIPVGKKLTIKRRDVRDSVEIESTVIKNDDMKLKVRLAKPVESRPGEFWRVHYNFGSSVWEFDTSVIDCSGDVLVLKHSDRVRFVNRRRFLRVPVHMLAYIAHFPFSRTFNVNGNGQQQAESSSGQITKRGSADTFDRAWRPPEFVPAVVTELAGPGLRIEAALKVKVGDRVLTVFKLDEEKQQNGKTPTAKIIQDIGVVKHVEAIHDGWSIAVELVGLSDSDVNELIRATNAAALKASSQGQDVPGAPNAEASVPKGATVQGA